jgi:integral membrane protein
MNIRIFTDPLGRLRILSWLEGTTLLALVFIAVPMKYFLHESWLVGLLGPIHGSAFMLFLLSALNVGVSRRWKFRQTTWKLILACFIPFGTFYIDHDFLKPLYKAS